MAALPETTGEFVSPDGIKIFYRQYQAESERARMVLSHGVGEHSGRYGNVIERVLPKGFSVWAPDHRGHGQSGGKRGHVLNFVQYLTDLRLTVELAKKDMPGEMPCFLLGHSMGGLIALYFAQHYPELIDGVVASSPCLGMVIEIPAAKKVLGSFMSYVWPGMTMGSGLDATKISRDENVVSAYKNDPLVHDRVSARFFTELLAAMESVNQQASALNVPVLMQVAGEDYLVNADSSKHFFEKLTLQDKTLHVYDDMYHEIYNAPEDQKGRVLDDLETWLQKEFRMT
ncbi:MAG: lysophospholipase [Deltaproteobacteria bacterium]|nr:lysophospholipase [Deltaproteobacteria bacterium]MBW2656807.1 lysophospholipase [Deltaproteobacteria bacterium]